jgi:DNA-directed RNA polymerase subunit RPC12/RpoP
MADDVMCPECDERITVKFRSEGVKCPACGTQVLKPASEERAGREDKTEKAKKTKAQKEGEPGAAKIKPGSKPRKRRGDDDDYEHDHPKGRRKPSTNGVPTGAVITGLLIVIGGVIALIVWAVRPGEKPTDPPQVVGGPNLNPNPNPNQGPGPGPALGPGPAPGRGPIRQGSVDTRAAEGALPKVTAPFDVDPLLEQPNRPVYLADMQEFGVQMGPWRFGKGELGDGANTAIKVKGEPALKGLSVHPRDRAATRVAYALGGRAVTLAGAAGLNDETLAPVVFKVIGDGRELWKSEPTTRASGPAQFLVDVRGVQVLELRAITLGSHLNAHAVWVDPVIEK